MKTDRRRFLLAAGAAALAASLPAQADGLAEIRQRGSLRVAVYNGFVPWSDKGNGIDVELAQALGKQLGIATQVVGYNARYVYFSLANDCIHSGAAGVPQAQSAPCSQQEIDELVDRVIEVAEDAMDVGLVPVFSRYPAYNDINLSIQAAATGLTWYANESQWNAIADTFEDRIADELPGAILVDAWRHMEVLPDGLHPTPKSANKAAKRIREAIEEYEGCQ